VSRRAALRRHPLARLVVLVLGLVAAGSGYTAVASQVATASPASTSSVAEGHRLFLANCSTCHGVNAQGRDTAPSLVGVGAAAVDFQVGTGRMPAQSTGPQVPRRPQPQFTAQQIQDLAAYVASLAPGPAVPDAAAVDASGSDPSRGGLIFRTNCAMCHNYAGKGGALTNGKYAPNLSSTTPTHIYEAMLTGPQSMPVFADSTMDPQSKRDIIAYLESVRSTPSPGGWSLGSLGPVPEGLVAWVLGLGLLIGCAVWLGARAS